VKKLSTLLGLCLALAAPSMALANDYPTKPIRIVLPYAPGGPTDTVARAVAQQMAKTLDTAIIIDNRPGADSTIGTQHVVQSPADGYSLLFGTSSTFINASIYKLNYDPSHELAGIGLVGTQYLVLVTRPDLKFENVQAFIKQVKERSAEYNYGTSGSTVTLVTELFHTHAGISGGQRIPYNGNAPLLNAFYSGVLDYSFMSLDSGIVGIRSGKLLPLAVTAPTRVSSLPQIPTTLEAGVPESSAGVSYFLGAPRNTPPVILKKLNEALNRALASPDVKELGNKFAGLVLSEKTSIEEANRYMKFEQARWAPIVKKTGVKPG
jgi:tripartite-type tricarboxylate transporter receptor subunit TctC